MASERLAVGRDMAEKFASVDRQVVDAPVQWRWYYDISHNEFWLDFTLAEKARTPKYRFSSDDDFTKVVLPKRDISGTFLPIGQHGLTKEDFDGTLVTMIQLKVPDSTPAATLEIIYNDRNGVPRGPFTFDFLPQQMIREQALKVVKESSPNEWVEFDDGWGSVRNGRKIETTEIWFDGLLQLGWRGVKRIRYGLNVDTPNQDFPVPTDDYGPGTKSQYMFVSEEKIRFVTLQVTFIDGTTTEVLRFENPEQVNSEQKMREQALNRIKQRSSPDEWVEFHDGWGSVRNGRKIETTEIWFNGLLQHGWRAVKSIRYGLNVDTPNQDFPVPTDDYSGETQSQYMFTTEEKIRLVVLQVTLIDGTTTEVLRFENPDEQ